MTQPSGKRKRGRPRKEVAPPIPLGQLSAEEEDLILDLAARQAGGTDFFATLEDLLCDAGGFGLTTATPLQRAICRIIEGRELGDLQQHEHVVGALGGLTDYAPKQRPAEVVIVAGVRGAKSMIAAATAISASQTCDLSRLSPGEIPRYSVASLSLDNARVIHAHLLGALQQPRLQHLRVAEKEASAWRDIIDESGSDVIGSIFLWHPSGRPVEIRVVAGKKAGGSLVSRWSIGACFDEAPRMVGAAEGVINYDDSRRAVRTRLLPGAQILSIGSPWQPFGPIYDVVQNEWGNPVPGRIVIKARGPWMNPYWWTEERCEEIKQTDAVAYQTDVLAEFADLEESLFPQTTLAKAVRKNEPGIPWAAGRNYVAAMDPATRNNAWTLVVCDRLGRKKRVVLATQWQGSTLEPLSPRAVLKEAKEILDEYRLDWAYTDQWAADALRDIALDVGLVLIVEDWTEKGKVDAFLSLAAAMADGTIEIPDDPLVTKDLRLSKKIATNRGVAIRLVHTPDGRHCDYAAALARAVFRWINDEKQLPPKQGDPGYWEHWAAKQETKEVNELTAAAEKPWWDRGAAGGESGDLWN